MKDNELIDWIKSIYDKDIKDNYGQSLILKIHYGYWMIVQRSYVTYTTPDYILLKKLAINEVRNILKNLSCNIIKRDFSYNEINSEEKRRIQMWKNKL